MIGDYRRWVPLILLIGDWTALFLFVLIGERDHGLIDPARPIVPLLVTTSEFAVPWALAGWWLGAFALTRRASGATPAVVPFFGRTLNTWLVAAPIALLLRALVLQRAAIPTLFIIVATTLGGLFVFAWRLVFLLIWRAAVHSDAPISYKGT